jgi:hypothetical protein
MKVRALLALLLAAAITRADDLRLSASCDDQGNLMLHGEGPFGSGETVDIRLLRCVGNSRALPTWMPKRKRAAGR